MPHFLPQFNGIESYFLPPGLEKPPLLPHIPPGGLFRLRRICPQSAEGQAAMHTILPHLTDWAAHYGGMAFFPFMYINSVGVPLIPAETLLLAGAVLAAKGKISFAAMIVCAYLGSVLGSLTSYFIGRLGGEKLVGRIIALFRLDAAKFTRFQAQVQKHGFWFIIVARFIPVARELNGLIGGSLGMSFSRYMAGNIIGAFFWLLAWVALPYFLGVEL